MHQRNAARVLLDESHRILPGLEHPVGVYFGFNKQWVRVFQKNIFPHLPIFQCFELKIVVVVAQGQTAAAEALAVLIQ